MTEEHDIGANNVLENINRFCLWSSRICCIASQAICSNWQLHKWNEKWYMFAYMESFVTLKLFYPIDISFLPIGRTQEYDSKVFNRISNQPRSKDSIKLSDIHSELRQRYCGQTEVVRTRSLISWLAIIAIEHSFLSIMGFFQYRYFSFNAQGVEKCSNALSRPSYDARIWASDEWSLFQERKTEHESGFLLSVSNLHKTTGTSLVCPARKLEVTNPFEVEEERMKDHNKMGDLYRLCDVLNETKVEPFYLDFGKYWKVGKVLSCMQIMLRVMC